MSSEIIMKIDYVKCAGFLSAFVEVNGFNAPLLRIWNSKKKRLQGAEDIKEDFCKLLELNTKSVAIQYKETNPEVVIIEDNPYNAEFLQYKKCAERFLKKGLYLLNQNEKKELQIAIYSVIKFFDSILYQIEIESCIEQANKILFTYYKQLFVILRCLDDISEQELDTWATFDIFD